MIEGSIEVGPEGVEWEPRSQNLEAGSIVMDERFVWVVANEQGTILGRSQEPLGDRFLSQILPNLRFGATRGTTRQGYDGDWQAGQRWIGPPSESKAHALPADLHDLDGRHRALSVTAAVSLTAIRTVLRQLAGALVGFSTTIWLLGLLACRLVSRRALLPLGQMAVATRQIDADDLIQRLPVIATQDELQGLNRSFNEMLDRLQVAFERQRRLTGKASHQLRTPLAAILGQIEVALRRERPADEYRHVLGKVQHLARVTESLLFLTRADSDAVSPDSEPIDLLAWLTQHLETWSEHARVRDLVLEGQNVGGWIVDIPLVLLAELLDILIDNACKYSEPSTPIKIRIQPEQGGVAISIEDQGYGISSSDLATVFQPFYQSEEARRRGIDGVGLGLSIAKRLAGVVGADLSVTSQPSRGTCFTMRLAGRRHGETCST